MSKNHDFAMPSSVNPPGFDMRNAMSSQDVSAWPLKAAFDDANIWGRMIVDDRKASMSVVRRFVDSAHKYEGVAAQVRARILMFVEDGLSQDSTAIY